MISECGGGTLVWPLRVLWDGAFLSRRVRWPLPGLSLVWPLWSCPVHTFPKAAEAAGSSAPRPTNSALQAGAAAPGGQQGRFPASSGICSLCPDLPSHVLPH